MLINQFRLYAVIILLICMFVHLFPTIILSAIKKGKGGRPIWATYLSWFIMLPILFGPLIAGRNAFIILCFVVSILGIMEFARHTVLRDDKLSKLIISFCLCILYITVFLNKSELLLCLYFLSYVLIIFYYLLRQEPEKGLDRLLLSLLLFTFCGVFFIFLPLLYNERSGKEFLFIYFLLLINNDAFGYIFGTIFGKHRLIPKVSPNKTVEGFIVGICATVLIGLVLRHYLVPGYPIGYFLILCIILSLGGITGDLVMSMFKRSLKLKDFGNLIPGHGGILDRLDSLLFIAPVFYFYIVNLH
ncbi:MAG: phosphatidate cytidylyltransferase [Clostridia bacterium]|nr:phosphatidate cytidylyltransferase [Clostridia bacterium]